MNSRVRDAMIRVVFIVVFIVSCAPAQETPPDPTAIISPTATSVAPTPTPTRVPLQSIDLEELLIQPGDLPSGLSGAQIRDAAPGMFARLPKSVKEAYQQFESRGTTRGGVTVLLYESPDDLESAYQMIVKGFDGAESVTEVGTIAAMSTSTLAPGDDLVFVECQAVAHIRMFEDQPSLIAYARRLDERLKNQVCR